MARTTDPEKLAALRAREAVNARAYRARQKEAREATPPPNVTGRYQQSRKPEYVPGTGLLQRAYREVQAARVKQDSVIRSLPDIRNTTKRVAIRVPERPETSLNLAGIRTRKGMETAAKRLRDEHKSTQLQGFGKSKRQQLRTELTHGPVAEMLQENMNREQQDRFQRLSERIAKPSNQAVAILFKHLGGAGTYDSIISKLLYPKDSSIDDSLDRLEELADQADRADKTYSPAAIRRERGGNGRLSI